jgi:hypothetical protein
MGSVFLEIIEVAVSDGVAVEQDNGGALVWP